MPSTPFVDRTDATLDIPQIIAEAIPLAKLAGLFSVVAVVPFALAVLLGPGSGLGMLLAFLAQFVLAVGTGVVLMYVIARGMHLSGER